MAERIKGFGDIHYGHRHVCDKYIKNGAIIWDKPATEQKMWFGEFYGLRFIQNCPHSKELI